MKYTDPMIQCYFNALSIESFVFSEGNFLVSWIIWLNSPRRSSSFGSQTALHLAISTFYNSAKVSTFWPIISMCAQISLKLFNVIWLKLQILPYTYVITTILSHSQCMESPWCGEDHPIILPCINYKTTEPAQRA